MGGVCPRWQLSGFAVVLGSCCPGGGCPSGCILLELQYDNFSLCDTRMLENAQLSAAKTLLGCL